VIVYQHDYKYEKLEILLLVRWGKNSCRILTVPPLLPLLNLRFLFFPTCLPHISYDFHIVLFFFILMIEKNVMSMICEKCEREGMDMFDYVVHIDHV